MGTQSNVYWLAGVDLPAFPRLDRRIAVDVAVVGGGIVGITAARRLKDLGFTVAVVEARQVGTEVTGRSTAKVTSQHRTTYSTLARKYDDAHAGLYADAQMAGVRTIRELVSKYQLDCDLEDQPAFVVARTEDELEPVRREAEVAARLGLPAGLQDALDLPFPVLAALRFDDQAQFHPVKYVAGLAATLPGDGCHVFERSRVIDWSPTQVQTEDGAVEARHVVMATHMPLGQLGGYFAKAYPKAEPVIAAPIGRDPRGMLITAGTPSRSIRTHTRADGTVYGIAAGDSFKPGHTDDEREAFESLARWLTEVFAAGPVEYRWVNEDYSSMDETPFVGWSSDDADDRYLVATGFAAWGISNGTAAALLIADLVAGRDNRWAPLFDAGRKRPLKGGPKFAAENAAVGVELAKGFVSGKFKSIDELAPGDAAVLNVDGDQVAAYRDDDGTLHAVSAVCTHLGCVVGWNATDRTWDCPCHGSRFQLDGEVIHGPAVRPLRRPHDGA